MVNKIQRSAPGKVILCGEHSVVYGQPAIAVPVSGLRAYANVEAAPTEGSLQLISRDLNETISLEVAPPEHPLAAIARETLAYLTLPSPAASLTLWSELPIASGLGSGAAVSVAIARALAAYLGRELQPQEVSALAYEVEKIHHGTPSGIDNTVIAYEAPVYFVKGQPPEIFVIKEPFYLVIANSGIPSATKQAVMGVRNRRNAKPEEYDTYFNRMGEIANAARTAIEQGDIASLAPLLNENHSLLREIGVSLPELDRLVAVAKNAGATGAKLTGAGTGGNVIALTSPENIASVKAAMQAAGATEVWTT
ncbi:MAG: mevalonate kinase, partial [Anaerolineae bacterium]|nr:mevalonate kinase [Anaerolineae bacterium]